MADEQGLDMQNKFLLFLSNNEVFVWDTEAVLTLRRKYRIVGSLVGSLPSKPRQNLVFSLPLVLQSEEVKLLLEKNVARLVVNDSATSPPNKETVTRFHEERKVNVDQQIAKLKEIKKQKLEEFAEVIEEARERKREEFPNRKRKGLSDNEEDDSKRQRYAEEWEHDTDDSRMVMCDKSFSPNKLEKTIDKDATTSSEHNTQDNLQDSTLICITSQHHPSLQQTRDAKWTFPENETDRQRYKVFVDLWEKGYYITQGSKFGGDYLVYPSDPFRFHSYFVVTVVPWNKSIHSLDLVSVGRLGSTVKKTSVLASVDADGHVIYTSIQWPGFT